MGKKSNRKRKDAGAESLFDRIKLLPLMMLSGVVPIVVFLKVKPVPELYRDFWTGKYVTDFFSYYKANLILILTVLLLVTLVILHFYQKLNVKKNILYVFITIIAFLIILSTVFSAHKSIALNGFFDRYEGMWVLLAYLIILVGTYLLVNTEKEIMPVLHSIYFSALIISVIGIFQYFGMDLFQTMLGKKLILPAQLEHMAPNLKFNFGKYTIYSTLYNTNYVGSFMAMVFPLTFTLFLLAKERKKKILLGSLSVLFFAVQIGCRSRGGMVAAFVAFIFVFLLLRKHIFKNWKPILTVFVLYAAVFVGMDAYSGGGLSGQVRRLQEDIQQVSLQADEVQDKENTDALQEEQLPGEISWAERYIEKYGRLGSGRGYIWIRTIEMLNDTIFLGKGPDTFALYFPNKDPLKDAYGFEHKLVDKPHSMYLQWGVNIGVVSLLIFLVLIKIHFIQSFVLLWKKGINSKAGIYAIGLFAAWCGYLISGVFNDSIVSVAPVFWVIFGMSMAANEMLKHS